MSVIAALNFMNWWIFLFKLRLCVRFKLWTQGPLTHFSSSAVSFWIQLLFFLLVFVFHFLVQTLGSEQLEVLLCHLWLTLFAVLYLSKLNIFEFWTVGWTKWDIWRRHFRFWRLGWTFYCSLTFYRQTASSGQWGRASKKRSVKNLSF